jgi:hypothetical protein
MKLIDKITVGICGVMLAGGITTTASLYSMANPLFQMAKNPAEVTDEAKNLYVSQYPTKERIFYTGLGLMGLSILASAPLSLYNRIKFNKLIRNIEEDCKRIGEEK